MKLQHISFTIHVELVFTSESVVGLVFWCVWLFSFLPAVIELKSDRKLTDEENCSCVVSSQSSCRKRIGRILQGAQISDHRKKTFSFSTGPY